MHIEFNKVTWYSKLGAIILFLIIVPYITFYFVQEYQEIKDINKSIEINNKSTNIINSQVNTDFLNGTYEIDGELIKFNNGKAGEIYIFNEPIIADLDNNNKSDAVFFIVQETSGTGTFFYVSSAINSDKGYVSTNSIFIGDRIAPQNIRVQDGIIQVNYVTRKETDPMSEEPTIGITKYLKVVNGELIEVK